MKLVNNLIIGVTMCALAEALALGVKAGVDPDILVAALGDGSADSFVLQHQVKNLVMKRKFA